MDQEIWVVQIDGSGEDLLARGFASIYGVGPVWSPTGDRIVYQRMKSAGTEAHDVVLVAPDGKSEGGPARSAAAWDRCVGLLATGQCHVVARRQGSPVLGMD